MRVRTSGELGLVRGQLAVFHGFWVTLVNNLALINLLTSLRAGKQANGNSLSGRRTICLASRKLCAGTGIALNTRSSSILTEYSPPQREILSACVSVCVLIK